MESPAGFVSNSEVRMSVHGIGRNSPVQKTVNNPIQKSVKPGSALPARGSDKVELSGVSHLLHALKTGSDFRADKVADIKAQIAAGKYLDDRKENIAIDRLLDDLL
jgi:flagellar biosynthesis anti-sigma factor FlgM